MACTRTVRFCWSIPVYEEVRIDTWSHSMPLYSRISWTAMPIGAPPRHIPTRNVGLKPLRTTCRPSSIESRNSESAEMKILSEEPADIVVLRTQGIAHTHRRSYGSHIVLVLSIVGSPKRCPSPAARALSTKLAFAAPIAKVSPQTMDDANSSMGALVMRLLTDS